MLLQVNFSKNIRSVLRQLTENQQTALKAENLTLDQLLIGSPKNRLCTTEEDKEWIYAPLTGKEFQ